MKSDVVKAVFQDELGLNRRWNSNAYLYSASARPYTLGSDFIWNVRGSRFGNGFIDIPYALAADELRSNADGGVKIYGRPHKVHGDARSRGCDRPCQQEYRAV